MASPTPDRVFGYVANPLKKFKKDKELAGVLPFNKLV